MNQLQLKHIAPYLPYKLQTLFDFIDGREENGVISAIHCIDTGFGVDITTDLTGYPWSVNSLEIKPCLRPLSQLTQPIRHEGYNDNKPFIPIVELAKVAGVITEDRPFSKITFNDEVEAICIEGTYLERFGFNDEDKSFFIKGHCLHSKGSTKHQRECSMPNQLQLFEMLYQWHFWLGDQSWFEQELLIEKK